MAPPVGILGPVPAVLGLGFAWKQTGLAPLSGDFQFRTPLFSNPRTHEYRIPSLWTGQNFLIPIVFAPDVTHMPLPFDWGNPEGPIRDISLYSFINQRTTARAPFFQTDWPVPTPPFRIQQSITASYLLTLLGQDRMLAGKQVFDLTPRPYEFSNLFRTWAGWYNLNLIGKDALPTGKQVFALTTPAADPFSALRTWTQNLLETTLFTQPSVPIPLPLGLPRQWPLPQPLPGYGSWTLNLLQSTLAPVVPGDTTHIILPFDWSNPEGFPYKDFTYTQSNLQLLTAPVTAAVLARAPIYTNPREFPYFANLRSFTGSLNLNLIGKDQLPSGKIFYDRPPLAPSLLQSWIASVNIPLTGAPQNPFFQTSWPLTPAAQQPERTVTASYNQNLIGQDKLPFRQADWPNPTQPYRQPQLSAWIDQVKFLLQVPFKQLDWPVPYGPRQPIQIHTASYNLNLIGQDQLPVGAKVSDIPPQPALSAAQLRTWINFVSLALVTPAQFPRPPFNQFDWPINPGPQQPTQLFYASFNKNLIGQDKLPVGDIVTELPKAPLQPIPIFVASYNKNLIGKDKLPVGENVTDLWPRPPTPPGLTWLQGFNLFRQPIIIVPLPPNQYDWPNPRGPGQIDRTITLRSQFLQPAVPPPSLPNVEAPLVRDFWDVDEWGNFIKGYCVRGT